MEVDFAKIDGIVDHYGQGKSSLIQVLQDVQKEYRYLPKEALVHLSDKLDIPLSLTYNVATFYTTFSLIPKGKHHVSVCMGTACHVRGANHILEKFERALDVKSGGTTADKEFSLDHVGCLGACALGPVVTVDEEYHGQMELRKVDRVLKPFRKKAKKE
jgi:NADH-quinone oxidoreductase subunit E